MKEKAGLFSCHQVVAESTCMEVYTCIRNSVGLRPRVLIIEISFAQRRRIYKMIFKGFHLI